MAPFPTNWKPIGGGFDRDSSTRRLNEIERRLAAPGAWDNPEALTPMLQEKSRLESETRRLDALLSARSDAEEWLALADEEETPETVAHLIEALTSLRALLDQAEMDLLLSEEEDHFSAIVEIHPGAGGTEAQDWAAMLLRMYQRWADRRDYKVEVLD